jgi:transcriptional regulator with XRE-family HTH domain
VETSPGVESARLELGGAETANRAPLRGGSRSELGKFLRSRREKLTPELVGIAEGRRRRAPGLRREEVAELAGIGVDWYIRLEQGRAVKPSTATTDALARALLLDKAEHAHLRALAASGGRRPFQLEVVPEPLGRLIQALTQPAYITGRRWDILAWNDAAARVFAFDRLPPDDRNILVCMFTNPATRRFFGAGWEAAAQRMIANFRTTYDLWAGDPAFASLLNRLQCNSAEFALWWEAHDVRSRSGGGRKTIEHPREGTLQFEHASFQSNLDPALRLAIYAPVP